MGEDNNTNNVVGEVTTDQNGANNSNATGTEDVNNTNNNDKQNQQQSNNDKTEKVFTQKQVSSMMSKEKKQGRDAALRDLGIDPSNETMVNLIKQLISNLKPEGQVAAEQAAANKTAIDEANNKAMIAETKAEIMMAGINKDFVDDATTLALSKVNETTDLKTVIDELKEKYPIWFDDEGESQTDSQKKSKVNVKGTGSSIKGAKNNNSGTNNKSLGERLATQRRASLKNQKSFWD